jgi:hypothetical protein
MTEPISDEALARLREAHAKWDAAISDQTVSDVGLALRAGRVMGGVAALLARLDRAEKMLFNFVTPDGWSAHIERLRALMYDPHAPLPGEQPGDLR